MSLLHSDSFPSESCTNMKARLTLMRILPALLLTHVVAIAVAQDPGLIPDNLTLQTGDTPTLRFKHTGADWSISGNELGLSLKDLQWARTPLIVDTGLPTNTFVAFDQQAGIGTASPQAGLHVVRKALVGPEMLARFQVADGGQAWLDFANASSGANVFIPKVFGKAEAVNAALIIEGTVNVDSGTSPVLVFNTSLPRGGPTTRTLAVFRNNGANKVTISSTGDVQATSFNPVSSRVLKDKILELSATQALDALSQITPVKYVYKDDETRQQRVGFIAEDVPAIVANADRQSVPIMDIVALVTRAVKDQQQTIEELQSSIKTRAGLIKSQNEQIESQRRQLTAQAQSIQDQQVTRRQQEKVIQELTRRLAGLETR